MTEISHVLLETEAGNTKEPLTHILVYYSNPLRVIAWSPEIGTTARINRLPNEAREVFIERAVASSFEDSNAETTVLEGHNAWDSEACPNNGAD